MVGNVTMDRLLYIIIRIWVRGELFISLQILKYFRDYPNANCTESDRHITMDSNMDGAVIKIVQRDIAQFAKLFSIRS